MHIALTNDDARLLGAVLRDHLPDLRREAARTDERTMRHELERRLEMCERLLARLDQTKCLIGTKRAPAAKL